MKEGSPLFTEQYKEQERNIMPKALKRFYIEARANTYAANAEPEEHPAIPGSKELRDHHNERYFYVDTYVDSRERPGNFFGQEIIREESYEGPIKITLAYGGGLTKKGLELGKRRVYSKLRQVLKNRAEDVRFGNKVLEVIFDQKFLKGGQWIYKDDGVKEDWGWHGTETITYNGEIVYTLTYTGGAFVEGF